MTNTDREPRDVADVLAEMTARDREEFIPDGDIKMPTLEELESVESDE